jgi:hypothetical protein
MQYNEVLTSDNKRCHHSYGDGSGFVDEGFRQEVTQRQHKGPQGDVVEPGRITARFFVLFALDEL